MKELTIEQKAKRYDDAIKVAMYWEKNPTVWSSDDICQKLFPELKESEDERIRKAIKKALQVRCDGSRIISDEPVTLEEAIAWLEKQGEQKPNCCDGQKPKTHNGSDNPYDMSYPDAEGYISKRGFDVPWCDCDVFVDNRYITQTVGNILRWADDNPKQKHAEWSEEDERMCTKIIFTLAGFMGNEDKLDWLKSLKDRVQPKQEWSEEDEYVYNEILKRVADKKLYEHDLEYIYNWLKSLRLQNHWKPSEEQVKALELSIVSFVPKTDPALRRPLNELLDQLRAL